jgi:hypothetical protein
MTLSWSVKAKYVVLQILMKHHSFEQVVSSQNNKLEISQHLLKGLRYCPALLFNCFLIASFGKYAQKAFLTFMEVVKKKEENIDAFVYFETYVIPCLIELLFSPEYSQPTIQFTLPYLMKMFLKNNTKSLVDATLNYQVTDSIPLRNMNICVQVLSHCQSKQIDAEFIHSNFRNRMTTFEFPNFLIT